ncbi:MAG: GTP cyclohydrolase II, partial [Bdellovibrionales bacterium]|nr:GTP cyclohydrolase II [Bdellovibrionales bacterium]
VTADQIAFMMRSGRGLVCTSVSSDIAGRLNLPLQVTENNSLFGTPFTPSITVADRTHDHSTVSARLATVRAMIDPSAAAEQFVSPGSVFPLIANPAGVVGRNGQTEGSYDLARLAGCTPAALICEILAPDGSMLRGNALQNYAREHSLPITSVEEILRYRLEHEVLLREVYCGLQETKFGEYTAHLFRDDVSEKEHLALVLGDIQHEQPVLARIHSECLTGDVFGSERCDCGLQLQRAFEAIQQEGAGVILYLRQEGRGIGLSNKLRAYELQDRGRDTVQANLELGFQADERDFRVAVKILERLGIQQVKLLTNNPRKVDTLREAGIQVVERVPVIVPPSEHSAQYLQTKKEKLGHLL